ncbi:UDP-N-acetylmuramoyl-L-alanyl-D-glutamate--2,6-diaminopimelate ligase [Georgenia wutianyii]|uniref:UDP-N-acetylmuramyl-tripeptide synthetase n=1 Tax=Georgenia wutianyii TaxID=2585135 RepID=A0ABX5VQE3_9MICO|nr:UDP-N-acetylmuramoyl-L-alanyl-D-glutamate--2,6-diaminopimelate ligase [Georgenia wutianyii]QDB79643.1 UDP-N-acetylmuramoyl-L-alanyl-D-glutamate--2,6-diaminopimelate ligase [Georgenia wutianyii]
MRLGDLASALDLAAPAGAEEIEVRGATHQADWARPGDVFVAVRGARADGHRFIADAVARGAVAVLGEGLPDDVTCPVPYLRVPSARAALADAAATLAGHPSRGLTVLGVTGTDGKTTTSSLARHLLRSAGRPTGLLSTVGYELPDGVLRQPPAHFTTPEAPQVQQILRDMVDAGATHAVVEASSHALALDRVRGVDFDVAIWTNLTGEHLDFHGTMEQYFADKALLVQRARHAVLNADDAWTEQLIPMAASHVTYSAEGRPADWWASDVVEGADDLRFTVHGPDGTVQATLPMIGRFNVANALAAMAGVHATGVGLAELVAGLATFPGVAGRMEMADRGADDPRVIIDFAHTPPSLEKALETVRVTTDGRLWVVLGSAGGPRDPSKRAPLGEVATRLADVAVFTEEDHRDTPLVEILDEMERGAREAGRSNFRSIGDRREAIRHAVTEAGPQDTVVLAGKGPEETLERDTETIAWDEMAEAHAALALRHRAD